MSTTIEVSKTVIETTTPATALTVSTLTFFGITLSEWVFIGTAILLVLNIVIAVPKVLKIIFGKEHDAEP